MNKKGGHGFPAREVCPPPEGKKKVPAPRPRAVGADGGRPCHVGARRLRGGMGRSNAGSVNQARVRTSRGHGRAPGLDTPTPPLPRGNGIPAGQTTCFGQVGRRLRDGEQASRHHVDGKPGQDRRGTARTPSSEPPFRHPDFIVLKRDSCAEMSEAPESAGYLEPGRPREVRPAPHAGEAHESSRP